MATSNNNNKHDAMQATAWHDFQKRWKQMNSTTYDNLWLSTLRKYSDFHLKTANL